LREENEVLSLSQRIVQSFFLPSDGEGFWWRTRLLRRVRLFSHWCVFWPLLTTILGTILRLCFVTMVLFYISVQNLNCVKKMKILN